MYQDIQQDSEIESVDRLTNFLGTKLSSVSPSSKNLTPERKEEFQSLFDSIEAVLSRKSESDNFELLCNGLLLSLYCKLGSNKDLGELLVDLKSLKVLAKKIDEAYDTIENVSLCLLVESFILSQVNDTEIALEIIRQVLTETGDRQEQEGDDTVDEGSHKLPEWLNLLFLNTLCTLRFQGRSQDSTGKELAKQMLKYEKEFDRFLNAKISSLKRKTNQQKPAELNQILKNNIFTKLPTSFAVIVLLHFAGLLQDCFRIGDCLTICQKVLAQVFPDVQQEVDFIKCDAFIAQKKVNKAKQYMLSRYEKMLQDGIDKKLAEENLLFLVENLAFKKKLNPTDLNLLLDKLKTTKYTDGFATLKKALKPMPKQYEEFLRAGFKETITQLKTAIDDKDVLRNLEMITKESLQVLIQLQMFEQGYTIFKELEQLSSIISLEKTTELLSKFQNEALIFSSNSDLSAAESLLDAKDDIEFALDVENLIQQP